MSKPICIISPHKKGFFQADVYEDGFAEGIAPDWFCTGKKGDDQYSLINRVNESYPSIIFIAGITGVCVDCEEEHFNLEDNCIECGGIIGDI